MFKKYNWQQPIFKDDVISVILNGILSALLGGILAGLLDYLLGAVLGLPIVIGLFLFCYMIGSRMRKAYSSYHILYPTLSILFMIIGIIISDIAYIICATKGVGIWSILGSFNFYFNSLFGYVRNIIMYIKSLNIFPALIQFLNLGIMLYAFVLCFKLVKGKN